MTRPSPSRRLTRHLVLALALVGGIAGIARAADIYVVEARIERDGVSTLSPTFIATRGERALLVFDGERDLDVAVTILPATASEESTEPGALSLRVELVDPETRHDEIVEASLFRTTTLEIGERTLELAVREQEGAEQ